MTRRLTPAERLAATERDATLAALMKQATNWDRFLVEQAIFLTGLANDTFTANQLRDLLPDLSHGFLGVAINSLRSSGIIVKIPGAEVPSTLKNTHGHGLKVWHLTARGHRIAAQRFHQTEADAA
jgi:hypothetical protein